MSLTTILDKLAIIVCMYKNTYIFTKKRRGLPPPNFSVDGYTIQINEDLILNNKQTKF